MDRRNFRKIDLNEINENKPQMEPQVQLSKLPFTYPLRRSQRILRQLERYGIIPEGTSEVFLVEENDLLTYREVILNIDSGKWQDAIKFEIDSTHDNQV